jgi:hypothetical protein
VSEESIVQAIKQGWGWLGVDPVRIVMINAFANTIFQNADGTFWRVTPENLTCECTAYTATELDALTATEDFQIDWAMQNLVDAATNELGQLPADKCFW